jgi:hypothetical protein
VDEAGGVKNTHRAGRPKKAKNINQAWGSNPESRPIAYSIGKSRLTIGPTRLIVVQLPTSTKSRPSSLDHPHRGAKILRGALSSFFPSPLHRYPPVGGGPNHPLPRYPDRLRLPHLPVAVGRENLGRNTSSNYPHYSFGCDAVVMSLAGKVKVILLRSAVKGR